MLNLNFKNISKITFSYCLIFSLFFFNLENVQGEEKINLNYVETDIKNALEGIGNILNETFIFDPRVKGKINLVTKTPVSFNEAYKIITSTLKMKGYVLMKAEGFTMVMPESEGKKYAKLEEKKSKHENQITTKIFRLKNEKASDLIPIIKPLMSPNNTINSSQQSNSLIITDYISNLDRLEKIIYELDKTSSRTISFVKINHAIVSDILVILNNLIKSEKMNNESLELLPDLRTNSLIIKSKSIEDQKFVKNLIYKLDKPSASPGNVHIVHLKNAEAEKLAEVLRSTLSVNLEKNSSQSSLNQSNSPISRPLIPDGGNFGFIQADPKTNTLIIRANETIYKNLRYIIDQLDSRRAQVYVESLIIEISADKAKSLGVQWAGLSGTGSSDVRIGLLAGVADNLVSSGAEILSLSESVEANGLNGLAVALENNASANILSMPNLITLDNEEASIMVGKNVPFITGQFTSSNTSSVNPFQTIERKDIGLSLRLKPQISQNSTVKMEIYQETSSIQETSTSGLITNKRSIQTNVLVNDGDIIVLGGLIEDTLRNSIQKVPLLGDIPFFGKLFQFQSKSRAKTNLMVFLRPIVLKTASDSSSISVDRYDFINTPMNSIDLENKIDLPKINNFIIDKEPETDEIIDLRN